MAKYQLEVGARTVEDALSAWRGGADRVELYVSPTEGALTPSMGLVQAAVAAKKAAGSNLGLYFRKKEDYLTQMRIFCCQHYQKCEIYRAVMAAKYDEE